MRPRFSKRTLGKFENACAGLVLRNIDVAFADADIPLGDSGTEGAGQRRTRFRDYLASIDQADSRDVARLARALGTILEMYEPEAAKRPTGALAEAAARDGFPYEDGGFKVAAGSSLPFTVDTAREFEFIPERGNRLSALADENPTDAIGGAKELVESTCRTVLRLRGEPAPSGGADLTEIVKATLKSLELVPADVDQTKKAGGLVKRCLQQLGAVTSTVAELRNHYGSGHGRDGKWKGLSPRHARLALRSAVTIADFIAETHKERPKTVDKASRIFQVQ